MSESNNSSALESRLERPSHAARVPVELSFWQKPAVQQVMPFVTSLLFHVGIVGGALAIYKAADVVRRAVTREQIIIPDTNFVENADNGGVPNPGLEGDPTRAAMQNEDETVTDSTDWATRKSATLNKTLLSGSAEVSNTITPIGGGLTSGGTVSGLRPGSGEGGGDLAPFGPPGGGAGQGKGLFGVPGGNVKRIAYVCDASGSLFGTRALTIIKNELRDSISKLKPSQAFNVLFFREGDRPPTVLNDATNVLQLATAKNKESAYRMLEQLEIRGNTNPLRSLEMAFKMQPKPEMVFLLIDGVASTEVEPKDIDAKLAQLNADKSVRLQIIIAGSISREHESLVTAYTAISKANGGGEVRRVEK